MANVGCEIFLNTMALSGEPFALRNNEYVIIYPFQPTFKTPWFAIRLRSEFMPPGPVEAMRNFDGTPVDQVNVITCELDQNLKTWKWVELSSATKLWIKNMMLESGHKLDQWYYVAIEQIQYDDDDKSS